MSKKPNIVLITADQWRGDCLGCAEGRHPVMTPHMNQLAAEGVRFTQAYADCPVCMPQRVTLLTGQVASQFGLPHNFAQRSPVDVQTSLPTRLAREAGYQTKAIGKMHFQPGRARMGFEHIALHPNDYVIWLEETPNAGMYRGHGPGGNEVDGFRDQGARDGDDSLLNELFKATQRADACAGVDGADPARMAGAPGFEQVQRFRAAHLADGNAVGAQTQRRAHKIGKRCHAILRPHGDEVGRGALQLARALWISPPAARSIPVPCRRAEALRLSFRRWSRSSGQLLWPTC